MLHLLLGHRLCQMLVELQVWQYEAGHAMIFFNFVAKFRIKERGFEIRSAYSGRSE